MRVEQGQAEFQPVTITLESPEEVEYTRVLLNIRKQAALDSTQAVEVGPVASRTYMRDVFESGI